jgi:hypothetical protein
MMTWSEIAAIVGKTAPLLGGVLGGPAGAAIGSIVAAALGTENSPDAVAAALAGDPDAALKLRAIETSHEAELQRISLELARAEIADVADARARDVELAKLGKSNTRSTVMVISAALGLFACLLTLIVYRDKIPPEAVGIISVIAGQFGACLNSAFQFEFGSSRSSQVKDATIRDLTK